MLCVAFLNLFSCALMSKITSQSGGVAALPPRILRLTQKAVFEVVIEKQQNDKTVYERELNWEVVPYAIRNDKYYSIGTAFAISPTELATAFHVINLGTESKVYTSYFIRDSEGKVFEVDKITGGSSERDFLIFTVKDRVFSEYFNFKNSFSINEPVFSIGNALGEGIVIRSGMVLGTVDENESGRWKLLKSSADGNPGNSGGPLVTPKGEVVGLVTSLRDNILYSTPAQIITSYQRSTLSFRVKPNYGHLILQNNLTKIFELEVKLPCDYKIAQKEINDDYKKNYVAAMNELFAAAPEYLTGPNNAFLLNSTMSSIFPQLDFVDRNDNNWKLSRLDIKSVNLESDGKLLYSTVSDVNFFKIVRPKSVSVEKLNSDPHYIMDLILKNWRVERTLWRGDKYRILSFGAPSETGFFTDSLGRLWRTADWIISFDDRVVLMYILPLPDGPVVITTTQSSGQGFVYKWDINKLCDHVHAAYSANFEEWNEFLKLNFLPAFLLDFNFSWNRGTASIDFKLPDITLAAKNDVFPWSDMSELYLLPSHFKQDDEIKFGVTKLILNRNNRGKDYAVITRNLKPDSRLGTDYSDEWDDLLEEKFPFNAKPALSAKDNNGSIGSVLKADIPSNDVRWTLYMTLENPTEVELNEKFSRLQAGIDVIR
jgi:hypothetical protein